MKHTQGPWVCHNITAQASYVVAQGRVIAELRGNDYHKKDAALMSVAPELLTYVKEFLHYLKQSDDMSNVQNHLDGLIARAQGDI